MTTAAKSPATTDIDVLNVFLQHNLWPGSLKQLQGLMKKYPTLDALNNYAKTLHSGKRLSSTPAWVMKQLGPELGNKVAYLGVDTGIAKIFIQSAAQGWDAGKTQAALENNRWWQSHNDQQKKWIISGTGDRNVLRQQAAQQMSDTYQHLYGVYKDPNEFLKGGVDGLASGQLSIDQWTAAQMRTPEFKQRYAGNFARQAAGLSMLSPEQYRATEEDYKNQLRQAGIDPTQFDAPNDFVNLFAHDIRPDELGQRLNLYRTVSTDLLPQMRQEFEQAAGISPSERDLYGIISGQRPDLASKYFGAAGLPVPGNLSLDTIQQALKKSQLLQQARFSEGGQSDQIDKQPNPQQQSF